MRGTTVVAGGLAALVLAACGSGDSYDVDATDDEDTALSFSSHEELVEAARADGGTLRVNSSAQSETIAVIKESFEAKYPFLTVEITEQTGSEAERIILEVQAGTSDADVVHISEELYDEYVHYLVQADLLGMAQADVLGIPSEMINPEGSVVASASAISGFSYNPERIAASDVPKTWFLDPRFKGGQFLIDIEPANLASLGVLWGEEKLAEYARAIGAQEPTWVRGDTFSLTALAAGEFQLHAFSNFHSATRIQRNSPEAPLEVVLLEPIPVRIGHMSGIREGSDHVAAAVLYLEHLASPEIQKAYDDMDVAQSSIYGEGSLLNEFTAGKELSVLDWDSFADFDRYLKLIIEAWGFPTAQVQEQ